MLMQLEFFWIMLRCRDILYTLIMCAYVHMRVCVCVCVCI